MSRALLLAGSFLALAACEERREPGTEPVPEPTGRIRFVNAVPHPVVSHRALDVALDGRSLGTRVDFGTATGDAETPYDTAAAGTRTVVARRTAEPWTPIASRTVPVFEERDLTVVALPSGPRASDPPTLIALGDDANGTPPAGKVKIRVWHVSPSAGGTMDLYLTPRSVSDVGPLIPTREGMSPYSASGYLVLDEGDYTVRLTLGGTKDVLLTVHLDGLLSGAVRSVFAMDAPEGGTPLSSLVLVDR